MGAVGFYTKRPNFGPDETVIWRAACNWRQGKMARGGVLWLTSKALVFEPNRFDSWVGGESRRIGLAGITHVADERGSFSHWTPFGGGLRHRIRLDLANGGSEMLLLNRLDDRRRQIAKAVDAFRRG